MKPQHPLITPLALALTACASTQPTPSANATDAQNTAVAIAGTDIALTQAALPTATPPFSTSTPMPDVTFAPATSMPTQLPLPIITPDPIQVERWQEYQTELAKLILSTSGAEFPLYEGALCEWDILGRSGQELYVWAVCGRSDSGGRKPAVIYLNTDGSIRDVKVVFPGPSQDSKIQELFPTNIQEKVYLYYSSERSQEMGRHIMYRLTHPEEPPLVVLSTTPSP